MRLLFVLLLSLSVLTGCGRKPGHVDAPEGAIDYSYPPPAEVHP